MEIKTFRLRNFYRRLALIFLKNKININNINEIKKKLKKLIKFLLEKVKN